MSQNGLESLANHSMLDLFRMEVETQSAILTECLLAIERDPRATDKLQDMMRAAHSLKGAARIVGRDAAVQVSHSMEDCIVAVQKERLTLTDQHVDALLAGVDLLGRIAQVPDESLDSWATVHQTEIEAFRKAFRSQPTAEVNLSPATASPLALSPLEGGLDAVHPANAEIAISVPAQTKTTTKLPQTQERVFRVKADNLTRLLGLAGEARVGSRWVDTFTKDMLRLKQLQRGLAKGLDGLRESLADASLSQRSAGRLHEFHDHMTSFQQAMIERFEELERFDRRFASLSTRLYDEVLDCRMQPFGDGIQMFARMTRDLAHSLGKAARLEIVGEWTTVDRDILERLKAPLDHLLRNAIDHGLESPAQRQQAGKPPEGVLQLTARHSAGMLLITVADDGRGVELEAIRHAVVERKLTTLELARKMSETELFEFLFLPGFTLKESVSEISGRGVGLDVVQTMVKKVGGSVRVSSQRGQGTRFQLELPLTLSVIHTLLVEIGTEPYALPLGRVDRVLKLSREKIQVLEGRQHFTLGEQQIGLIAASQILELESQPYGDDISIVVLGDRTARYGVVVDRFLGEHELVVLPLHSRLGKVQNISAAALTPDGSPLLIIDVDDLVRNIENVITGQRLKQISANGGGEAKRARKHVLVVEDSLTIRELERKLLTNRGYVVDVAVDGMDGWNAVRTRHYDLVVTDVDMPRLDGIELVTLIRNDSRLKSLPVMIVSYKDRQEDRKRGLEAGADHYLTKGSFHDETLVAAVADLIGRVDA